MNSDNNQPLPSNKLLNKSIFSSSPSRATGSFKPTSLGSMIKNNKNSSYAFNKSSAAASPLQHHNNPLLQMLPRQTTASSSLSESQLPPPPSPSSLSFVTVRRRRGHQSDDDLDVNDLANTSTTSNNSNHQSILLQTTTTSPHSSSNSLLIDLNSIDQDEHNNSNDLVGGLIGTNDVPLVDDEEEVLVVDGFGGEEGSASNPFNFASADKFEDDFLQQSSMDEMHDEGLEEGEVEDEQEIGEEQQQQLDLLINHHNVHNIERLEDISEEIANVGGVDGGQFSADVDGLEASSMPGGFSFSEYPPQDVVKEANDDSENNNSDDIVDNEQEEDDGLVQLQETHSNLLFQNTTGLPSNLFNPDMLKSPRVFKLSGNRSSVATPNRSITTNMMEWAGATSSVTNTPEGGSYSLASSFMLDESAVAVDSPSSMTPGARKRQLAVRRSGIDSWSKTPTSSRLANTTSSQSPSLTALVEGDHNSSITDDILDNISSTDMPFTSSKMPWDVSLNTVTECSNEEADNNTTEELLLENKSGEVFDSILRQDNFLDNSINVSFEAATQTEADAMRIPVVIPTSDSNLSLLQAENSSVSEKEYRRQISALRMELKVAQSKIFEMEEDREMVSLEKKNDDEVEKLMADKRHIKREVVRLNGVVEAMEAEKAKHSTTIQSLRSANNSLSKEVTTLKAQLDETTKSKESHRKELDTLRTANLNLRGEMTSLTRELHSLRELTDTSKKTMESMKKEVDEIKLAKNSAIMEKNRVVKELEVKTTACETLTNNLKQEKQALSKSQQEAFLIKNDLSRKTEAFSELQSIIDIINSEAADMKLEIDSLKESLTQASLDNQRLAVEVEELKNRDDVLDNQQESSSEIARLNAEISCLKSERERLNCALEIEERERLELAKKNRDYDSAIEEIKVEFGKVMDERDEYKMMQCAESTKIAELENKLQELNTDNVNVQEQHEITLKQVRELRKEIGDLEVVKVELEVSVENTTNELELMRSEVVRHKADLEKEKEQADVAQSRSMLLMEQLDAEKEKYDTVFMELESQVQAVSSLNTELDVYKDKLEQSTRRYAQSQAELETARSRVAEYESETSRTTSKLQESGQQYIELKAEKERLTADLALFTEVKEVLETKLEQLTRQLDSQDVRIQESEVALDEERARVRELEHELNAVRMDELEPLRSQLHDSAARLAETEGENQVLKDYLTESQDIIRSHEMEIQESVAQLGVLQQQVEKKEEINQAWRKAYEKNKVTVSLFRKKKDEEISELQKERSALIATTRKIFEQVLAEGGDVTALQELVSQTSTSSS